MAKKTVISNPLLKTVIKINALICAACFAGLFLITYFPPTNEMMGEKLHWICEHILFMSAGAFLGLLGGRVAAPDH